MQCRPLIEVLAEIPDVRNARGKRHTVTAILALVSVAILCGYHSYSAAAHWARIYPADLVRALGFRHKTPRCAATLSTVMRKVDRGHGQVEYRRLTASEALVGYGDWPGRRQVFRFERSTGRLITGEVRAEEVYGVTSLDRAHATVERLLRLTRHHWRIENRSHWVRDVTFGEDRSRVGFGNMPEVMAALRNAAIGLLRVSGETNIAAACRRLAAQPTAALALLGLTVDN